MKLFLKHINPFNPDEIMAPSDETTRPWLSRLPKVVTAVIYTP